MKKFKSKAKDKRGREYVVTIILAVISVVLGVMLSNTLKGTFGKTTEGVDSKVNTVLDNIDMSGKLDSDAENGGGSGTTPELPHPTMRAGSSWYKSSTSKEDITRITFVNGPTVRDKTGEPDETWDASDVQNGSIIVKRYDKELYICDVNKTGKIYANEDSSYMFRGCSALTSLDVSNFDTSNVTNMSYMFYHCNSLTSLDLSSFDTSNVIYINSMFGGCSALTSLDLSGFNTSNVTEMSYMFYNCNKLTSLNLSDWNTSNVTTMDSMFYNCSKLTSILVGDGWNTSNVNNMYHMFYNCGVSNVTHK